MFAPPRNGSRRFSPLLRFGGMRLRARGGEFRALRSATRWRCPLDPCELGSARPADIGGEAA
ncbi:MAG: hypothetical protein K2J72_03105 [Oscillospiraceae bacterium]|nr:hypothetical protein [Oscillospiraceae bacterium]